MLLLAVCLAFCLSAACCWQHQRAPAKRRRRRRRRSRERARRFPSPSPASLVRGRSSRQFLLLRAPTTSARQSVYRVRKLLLTLAHHDGGGPARGANAAAAARHAAEDVAGLCACV